MVTRRHSQAGGLLERNWRWVVTIACCVGFTLALGMFRGFGVLFAVYVVRYDAPTSILSLIQTLWNVVLAVGAPISISLAEEFTERKVIIVGGLILSVSSFICSFTFSLPILLIFNGATNGLGLSLIISPFLLLVHKWSTTRAALANSIGFIGASIAQIAIPQLFNYTIEEYGVRGCLLIYSGLVLHVCVAGALARPYAGRRNIKRNSEELGDDGQNSLGDGHDETDFPIPVNNRSEMELKIYDGGERRCISDQCRHGSNTKPYGEDVQLAREPKNNGHTRTRCKDITEYDGDVDVKVDKTQLPHCNNSDNTPLREVCCPIVEDEPVWMTFDKVYRLSTGTMFKDNEKVRDDSPDLTNNVPTQSSIPTDQGLDVCDIGISRLRPCVMEYKNGYASDTELNSDYRIFNDKEYVDSATVIEKLIILPNHKSNGNQQSFNIARSDRDQSPSIVIAHGANKSTLSSKPVHSRGHLCATIVTKCGKRFVSQFTDPSIYGSFRCMTFLISTSIATSGIGTQINFVVRHLEENGFSRTDGALLMTICGCVEIVGRLIMGYFSDMRWIGAAMVMGVGCFLHGVNVAILPLLSSYTGHVIYAVVFGLTYASTNSLVVPIVARLQLPARSVAGAVGIAFFAQGAGLAIAPPLYGYVRDVTGSYNLVFYITGAMTILSSLLMFLDPWMKQLDEKRMRQAERQGREEALNR